MNIFILIQHHNSSVIIKGCFLSESNAIKQARKLFDNEKAFTDYRVYRYPVGELLNLQLNYCIYTTEDDEIPF